MANFKPLNEKEEKALNAFLKNINTDSKVRAQYFSKAPKKTPRDKSHS